MAREREMWVLPHQYSCGGYYIAERFPAGTAFTIKGQDYTDGLCFWLLSGREVLSEYQVKQRLGYCRERGEVITEVWADNLPDGARWLNLR